MRKKTYVSNSMINAQKILSELNIKSNWNEEFVQNNDWKFMIVMFTNKINLKFWSILEIL